MAKKPNAKRARVAKRTNRRACLKVGDVVQSAECTSQEGLFHELFRLVGAGEIEELHRNRLIVGILKCGLLQTRRDVEKKGLAADWKSNHQGRQKVKQDLKLSTRDDPAILRATELLKDLRRKYGRPPGQRLASHRGNDRDRHAPSR